MKSLVRATRAIVLATLTLAACERNGTGSGASVATSMVAATATSQSAVAGTAVAEAPAVRITDQRGQPMPGLSVTFTVAGGGSVASAMATTDATGTASAGTWTLGTTAGANTVTASHGTLAAVQFSATGQARAPATLTAVSATTQSAVAGTPVAEAPSVRVNDQTGAPLAGVAVAFAVTAGGGQIGSATAVTDASGVASAGTWTLGAAGVNTVTATVGSGTVQFNATAQARVPAAITATSATSQTALPGGAVAEPPTVRVNDQTGAPLAGATVTFAVTSGGGSVGNATATTDAAGIASAGSWTLGAAAGENTVTATAAGLPPVAFTATGFNPCAAITAYAVGSTVSGAWTATDCLVSNGSRRDLYSVTTTGEPVAFTLTSGTVDTYLALYDANNRVVATNNNDSGTNSAIRLLAPAGTYRLDAQTWTTTDNLGSYQLASGLFTPNALDCREVAIVPNLTVTATLRETDCSFLGYADLYIVMVYPGETLTARMESADVDAYLHLYDFTGRRVAQNDNGAGGTNALMTWTNSGTDVQRLRLYADTWTQGGTGQYTLTVTKN